MIPLTRFRIDRPSEQSERFNKLTLKLRLILNSVNRSSAFLLTNTTFFKVIQCKNPSYFSTLVTLL